MSAKHIYTFQLNVIVQVREDSVTPTPTQIQEALQKDLRVLCSRDTRLDEVLHVHGLNRMVVTPTGQWREIE